MVPVGLMFHTPLKQSILFIYGYNNSIFYNNYYNIYIQYMIIIILSAIDHWITKNYSRANARHPHWIQLRSITTSWKTLKKENSHHNHISSSHHNYCTKLPCVVSNDLKLGAAGQQKVIYSNNNDDDFRNTLTTQFLH